MAHGSPERELLTVEQAAGVMHKTVGAVRKLKDRGILKAVPQRINGRVMFTITDAKAAVGAIQVPANMRDSEGLRWRL